MTRKWELDGKETLMVTESSATLLSRPPTDRIFPFETDHRGLVKFLHENDHHYKVVRGQLAELVTEESKILQKRLIDAKHRIQQGDSKRECPARIDIRTH